MKCVITGHTTGIGKFLYDHFSSKKFEVIGISRTTGFDLTHDLNNVIKLSEGCDLFINSASVGTAQLELLNNLYNKVNKMIVFGSIAGDFNEQLNSEYSKNKFDLHKRCVDLNLLPNSKILYLNISMLEDAVNGDNLITYSEVAAVIDFWLQNPKLTSVSFEFKLTPFVLERAKNVFNISEENFNKIVSRMCNEKKQFL